MWFTKFLRSAFPFYLLFACIALMMLPMPPWMSEQDIVKALFIPTRILQTLIGIIVLVMVLKKTPPQMDAVAGGMAGVVFGAADFFLFYFLAVQGQQFLDHNLYLLTTLGAITDFMIACIAFKEFRKLYRAVRA